MISSPVGRHLGAYVVGPLLGRGGMGEVYKAEDTRLGRTVAIKVLPPLLRADPERKRRLEREARALAAINHPNICALFDVGHQDGIDFLVMEYVEGETLANRLGRGKLPLDEVFRVGIQIASALAAAHGQNVIHRDLKPANIILTSAGTKLLDFGLATRSPGSISYDTAAASTLTLPGLILGTPRYMAPEQIEGKDADARSDIFAFGTIAYEMATGRPAFEAGSVGATIAAVMEKDPPPLSTARPSAPPMLERLVRTCLAKSPDARWQSAADLTRELRVIAAEPPFVVGGYAYRRGVIPRVILGIAVAAFLVGGSLGAILEWGAREEPPSSLRRFSLAEDERFPVLEWGAREEPPLALRRFSLAEEERFPVWKPNDGSPMELTFAARRILSEPFQVHARALSSQLSTRLTSRDDGDATPVGWLKDGRIVFAKKHSSDGFGLSSVSPAGGTAVPFLSARMHSIEFAQNASIAPDDSTVAFAGQTTNDFRQGVWIGSAGTTTLKLYEPAPFAARDLFRAPQVRFSPDFKTLLAVYNDKIWLLPYPPDASKPPHRILEKLPAGAGGALFSWMPDSRHVVVSAASSSGAPSQMYLADTYSGTFRVIPGLGGTADHVQPAVSPDGDKLAFLATFSEHDFVSLDLQSSLVTSLSVNTPCKDQLPAWSANEWLLVYLSNCNGPQEVWVFDVRRNEAAVLVTAQNFPGGANGFRWPVLSHDGTRVIYGRVTQEEPNQLWITNVTNPDVGPVRLVKGDVGSEGAGSWSPNADEFVFWTRGAKGFSLMKAATTGSAPPVWLAESDQTTPIWSPDGDWILYGNKGLKLISRDGKETRDLAIQDALCTFSPKDSELLFCLTPDRSRASLQLFSMTKRGTNRKRLGTVPFEKQPFQNLGGGLRLSPSPDGRSVTYATRKAWSSLWLAEGLLRVKRP